MPFARAECVLGALPFVRLVRRGHLENQVDRVFIYWDNSNTLFGALDEAEEREGKTARHRIRIHFKTMLRLAHADRPVERALAAGSVPPEMQALWNRLSGAGVQVELDRGAVDRGEQQTADRVLQLQMLRDFADYNGDPGIAGVLTGDGQGSSTAPDSKPTWRGCIAAAGAWRCSPGQTPAISGCANGWKRTASSFPWTISTSR